METKTTVIRGFTIEVYELEPGNISATIGKNGAYSSLALVDDYEMIQPETLEEIPVPRSVIDAATAWACKHGY